MKKILNILLLAFLGSFLFLNANAGSLEQSKRMFDRLVGIPADQQTLDQMASLVEGGNPIAAAMIAVNHPKFYSLTLKNWITPWTNVDESNKAVLNDFTATAIGLIRDDIPFNQILFGDILYVGSGVTSAYSPANNDHYEELESSNINLMTSLQRRIQSQMNGIIDSAGVLTTRAYAQSYFSAGTNRRAIRFAFKTFFCKDLEQLSDLTIPDFRVRQDVDRKPGGDSRTFKSTCVGCHAGMDALGGAFAYFNYENNMLVHTNGSIQPKMLQNNNVFSAGHKTIDDSFINLWAFGSNASFGWGPTIVGNGARAFGRMLASSDQFATCMSEKVFQRVCLRKPSSSDDRSVIDSLKASFQESNRYNMKELFAHTAIKCMGD